MSFLGVYMGFIAGFVGRALLCLVAVLISAPALHAQEERMVRAEPTPSDGNAERIPTLEARGRAIIGRTLTSESRIP
jgi:hypothetical protein